MTAVQPCAARRTVQLFLATASIGLACAGGGGFEESNVTVLGEGGAGAMPLLTGGILAYGQECAVRVAPIPAFNCETGTLARITVDGVEPTRYTPDMNCDRPALLPRLPGEKTDGQCVPNSRALVLRDDSVAQISAFCRAKLIRPAGTNLYDEIDVIAHSVTTGSTCWFQAKANNPNGDPGIGLNGTRVPPPNEATPPPGSPSAREFWRSPDSTASEKCGDCHDNDPFYYTPFIAQTGQLPADPFGKYANDIGAAFQQWRKPVSLTPRGNTCIGCHRIGATFTCGKGALESIGGANSPGLDDWARQYPQSHWMPVMNLFTKRQWDVIYSEAVAQLERCCATPKADGCQFVPIPGGSDASGSQMEIGVGRP